MYMCAHTSARAFLMRHHPLYRPTSQLSLLLAFCRNCSTPPLLFVFLSFPIIHFTAIFCRCLSGKALAAKAERGGNEQDPELWARSVVVVVVM